MRERMREFITCSRKLGLIVTIKYKLGIAKEGKDFVTGGYEE